MGTKITKSNVRSAIRDDKAHMDYLKRDVRDDQRAGGRYKDINQTADEKHISKLAGDVKADGHFLSKHWNHSSPLNNMEMVGSAGSFDKGMYDAPELESFDAEGFDAGRKAKSQEPIEGQEEKEEKEIKPGDSTEKMGSKLDATAKKAADIDVASLFNKNTPLPSVEIAEGEVDGVAYGAADVDGHIAIDTSTVGYDDTMNLP